MQNNSGRDETNDVVDEAITTDYRLQLVLCFCRLDRKNRKLDIRVAKVFRCDLDEIILIGWWFVAINSNVRMPHESDPCEI